MSVRVSLKNNARGPRAIYNAQRQVVVVPPGQIVEAEISETLHGILLRRQKSSIQIVATKRVAPAPPPPVTEQEPSTEKVEIEAEGRNPRVPENWREIKDWNALRRLAIDLSGGPIKNRKQAIAAIEAAEYA